jgi:hypothetical protein
MVGGRVTYHHEMYLNHLRIHNFIQFSGALFGFLKKELSDGLFTRHRSPKSYCQHNYDGLRLVIIKDAGWLKKCV